MQSDVILFKRLKCVKSMVSTYLGMCVLGVGPFEMRIGVYSMVASS